MHNSQFHAHYQPLVWRTHPTILVGVISHYNSLTTGKMYLHTVSSVFLSYMPNFIVSYVGVGRSPWPSSGARDYRSLGRQFNFYKAGSVSHIHFIV